MSCKSCVTSPKKGQVQCQQSAVPLNQDRTKVNNQDAFWKSIINKYEDRNAGLEEELLHLRQRVEQMGAAVPAVMAFDMAKLAHDKPTANVDNLMQPQQSCKSSPAKSTSEPLKLPNMTNASIFSIESADIVYMEKIKELTKKEKNLIDEVNKLRSRDKALKTAKQKVQNLANTPVENRGVVSVPGPDLQNISENMLRENQRLYDEVSDLRLEIKHIHENVQGPMNRELERERRKTAALECQLKMKSAEVSCSKQDTYGEINLLRDKLESTTKNLGQVNDINVKLKDQINFLNRRMEQLQTDLINQKLSEATTLALLKAQLDKKPGTPLSSSGGTPPPSPPRPPSPGTQPPCSGPSNCPNSPRAVKNTMKPEKENTTELYGMARNLSCELANAAKDKSVPTSILETVADIKDLCDLIDEQCACKQLQTPQMKQIKSMPTPFKSQLKQCTDVSCKSKIKPSCADTKPYSARVIAKKDLISCNRQDETKPLRKDVLISCAVSQAAVSCQQSPTISQRASPKGANLEETLHAIPEEKSSQSSCSCSVNEESADIMVLETGNDDTATTTVVRPGVLEVVTEGNDGIIETTMIIAECGNIEVVTEFIACCSTSTSQDRAEERDYGDTCPTLCKVDPVCSEECQTRAEDITAEGITAEDIVAEDIVAEDVVCDATLCDKESDELMEAVVSDETEGSLSESHKKSSSLALQEETCNKETCLSSYQGEATGESGTEKITSSVEEEEEDLSIKQKPDTEEVTQGSEGTEQGPETASEKVDQENESIISETKSTESAQDVEKVAEKTSKANAVPEIEDSIKPAMSPKESKASSQPEVESVIVGQPISEKQSEASKIPEKESKTDKSLISGKTSHATKEPEEGSEVGSVTVGVGQPISEKQSEASKIREKESKTEGPEVESVTVGQPISEKQSEASKIPEKESMIAKSLVTETESKAEEEEETEKESTEKESTDKESTASQIPEKASEFEKPKTTDRASQAESEEKISVEKRSVASSQSKTSKRTGKSPEISPKASQVSEKSLDKDKDDDVQKVPPVIIEEPLTEEQLIDKDHIIITDMLSAAKEPPVQDAEVEPEPLPEAITTGSQVEVEKISVASETEEESIKHPEDMETIPEEADAKSVSIAPELELEQQIDNIAEDEKEEGPESGTEFIEAESESKQGEEIEEDILKVHAEKEPDVEAIEETLEIEKETHVEEEIAESLIDEQEDLLPTDEIDDGVCDRECIEVTSSLFEVLEGEPEETGQDVFEENTEDIFNIVLDSRTEEQDAAPEEDISEDALKERAEPEETTKDDISGVSQEAGDKGDIEEETHTETGSIAQEGGDQEQLVDKLANCEKCCQTKESTIIEKPKECTQCCCRCQAPAPIIISSCVCGLPFRQCTCRSSDDNQTSPFQELPCQRYTCASCQCSNRANQANRAFDAPVNKIKIKDMSCGSSVNKTDGNLYPKSTTAKSGESYDKVDTPNSKKNFCECPDILELLEKAKREMLAECQNIKNATDSEYDNRCVDDCDYFQCGYDNVSKRSQECYLMLSDANKNKGSKSNDCGELFMNQRNAQNADQMVSKTHEATTDTGHAIKEKSVDKTEEDYNYANCGFDYNSLKSTECVLQIEDAINKTTNKSNPKSTSAKSSNADACTKISEGKVSKSTESHQVKTRCNKCGSTFGEDKMKQQMKRPTTRRGQVVREYCSARCNCGAIIDDREEIVDQEFCHCKHSAKRLTGRKPSKIACRCESKSHGSIAMKKMSTKCMSPITSKSAKEPTTPTSIPKGTSAIKPIKEIMSNYSNKVTDTNSKIPLRVTTLNSTISSIAKCASKCEHETNTVNYDSKLSECKSNTYSGCDYESKKSNDGEKVTKTMENSTDLLCDKLCGIKSFDPNPSKFGNTKKHDDKAPIQSDFECRCDQSQDTKDLINKKVSSSATFVTIPEEAEETVIDLTCDATCGGNDYATNLAVVNKASLKKQTEKVKSSATMGKDSQIVNCDCSQTTKNKTSAYAPIPEEEPKCEPKCEPTCHHVRPEREINENKLAWVCDEACGKVINETARLMKQDMDKIRDEIEKIMCEENCNYSTASSNPTEYTCNDDCGRICSQVKPDEMYNENDLKKSSETDTTNLSETEITNIIASIEQKFCDTNCGQSVNADQFCGDISMHSFDCDKGENQHTNFKVLRCEDTCEGSQHRQIYNKDYICTTFSPLDCKEPFSKSDEEMKGYCYNQNYNFDKVISDFDNKTSGNSFDDDTTKKCDESCGAMQVKPRIRKNVPRLRKGSRDSLGSRESKTSNSSQRSENCSDKSENSLRCDELCGAIPETFRKDKIRRFPVCDSNCGTITERVSQEVESKCEANCGLVKITENQCDETCGLQKFGRMSSVIDNSLVIKCTEETDELLTACVEIQCNENCGKLKIPSSRNSKSSSRSSKDIKVNSDVKCAESCGKKSFDRCSSTCGKASIAKSEQNLEETEKPCEVLEQCVDTCGDITIHTCDVIYDQNIGELLEKKIPDEKSMPLPLSEKPFIDKLVKEKLQGDVADALDVINQETVSGDSIVEITKPLITKTEALVKTVSDKPPILRSNKNHECDQTCEKVCLDKSKSEGAGDQVHDADCTCIDCITSGEEQPESSTLSSRTEADSNTGGCTCQKPCNCIECKYIHPTISKPISIPPSTFYIPKFADGRPMCICDMVCRCAGKGGCDRCGSKGFRNLRTTFDESQIYATDSIHKNLDDRLGSLHSVGTKQSQNNVDTESKASINKNTRRPIIKIEESANSSRNTNELDEAMRLTIDNNKSDTLIDARSPYNIDNDDLEEDVVENADVGNDLIDDNAKMVNVSSTKPLEKDKVTNMEYSIKGETENLSKCEDITSCKAKRAKKILPKECTCVHPEEIDDEELPDTKECTCVYAEEIGDDEHPEKGISKSSNNSSSLEQMRHPLDRRHTPKIREGSEFSKIAQMFPKNYTGYESPRNANLNNKTAIHICSKTKSKNAKGITKNAKGITKTKIDITERDDLSKFNDKIEKLSTCENKLAKTHKIIIDKSSTSEKQDKKSTKILDQQSNAKEVFGKAIISLIATKQVTESEAKELRSNIPIRKMIKSRPSKRHLKKSKADDRDIELSEECDKVSKVSSNTLKKTQKPRSEQSKYTSRKTLNILKKSSSKSSEILDNCVENSIIPDESLPVFESTSLKSSNVVKMIEKVTHSLSRTLEANSVDISSVDFDTNKYTTKNTPEKVDSIPNSKPKIKARSLTAEKILAIKTEPLTVERNENDVSFKTNTSNETNCKSIVNKGIDKCKQTTSTENKEVVPQSHEEVSRIPKFKHDDQCAIKVSVQKEINEGSKYTILAEPSTCSLISNTELNNQSKIQSKILPTEAKPKNEIFRDDYRREIGELQDLMRQIRQACVVKKPEVKKDCKFAVTLSSLQEALGSFQERCNNKDLLIDAMRLKLNKPSLSNIDMITQNSEPPISDEDEEVNAESCEPSKFDGGISVVLQIVEVRRIGPNSLLIKWNPTTNKEVVGYEIYVNGVKKCHIYSVGRTTAIVDSLKILCSLEIKMFAFTKFGLCKPGAIAFYKF